MPPPRWTTDEEFDFLNARMPAWLENRSKGTLAPWVQQLFNEWLAEFGLPTPTAKELEAARGDVNAAKKAKRAEMRRVSDIIVPVLHTLTLNSASAAGSTTTRQLDHPEARDPRSW